MLTLVFSDLVNSTPVKAALPGADSGERNRLYYEAILLPHKGRMLARLGEFGGRLVDQIGDAFFFAFDDVARAARFAVAVQRDHRADPIDTPLGPARVRIGVHAGSPLPDPDGSGRLVGQEVDYAARLSALAEGGQVVLSDAAAALLRTAVLAEARSHPHGERDLKGIGRVPVFELLYDAKPPQPLREAALAADNLPPPPARMTGRADALAELLERLHAGGVVVLKGEGGMGKTTLALAAAHELLRTGDAPGGVCWVNCETRPDLAECVRQAAGLFFGDRCESEPPAGLGRRVLAHLGGDRRGLLVLDNFETVAGDADLVRWLAAVRPPARVLVTTREVPPGLDRQVVAVSELARADAVRLFLARAADAGGRTPPPADVVDALCGAVGDHPLSVELLAARSARTPTGFLLKQVQKGLAVLDAGKDPTRPDRQQGARACLAGSFDVLPADARRLLCDLSVLPAGFGADVLSAVTGGDDWLPAAEQLVAASLWRLTGELYTLHPLVRQFALERLGDGRPEAERRAAGGLAASAEAQLPLVSHGPDFVARSGHYLRWMGEQLPNLVAAVGWAESHGEWAVLPRVARATEFFWNTHGHWPTAERLGTAAVAAARHLGDPEAEAYAHDFLGFVYRHLGRDADAIAAHQLALTVCYANKAACRRLLGRIHARLGKVLGIVGQYREADDQFHLARKGYAVARDDGQYLLLLLVYSGQNAKYQGQFDRAVELFREALGGCKLLNSMPLEREAEYHLADTLYLLGRHADAEQHFRASARLARALNNREAEAKAMSGLGTVRMLQGDFAAARECLLAALDVHRATGFKNREGRALRRLAEVERAAGHSPAALAYARQAVAVMRMTESARWLEKAERLLAELESDQAGG
jgi:tetratricopeptide (TPR) repeat protein